jgi:hypothetical protein
MRLSEVAERLKYTTVVVVWIILVAVVTVTVVANVIQ